MQDQPLSFRAVPHLADAMRLRNIQPDQVLVTLRDPDLVVAARRGRIEYRKRYYDAILGKDMVLRVIVDPGMEPTVVTAIKTSRLRRYLPEERT